MESAKARFSKSHPGFRIGRGWEASGGCGHGCFVVCGSGGSEDSGGERCVGQRQEAAGVEEPGDGTWKAGLGRPGVGYRRAGRHRRGGIGRKRTALLKTAAHRVDLSIRGGMKRLGTRAPGNCGPGASCTLRLQPLGGDDGHLGGGVSQVKIDGLPDATEPDSQRIARRASWRVRTFKRRTASSTARPLGAVPCWAPSTGGPASGRNAGPVSL